MNFVGLDSRLEILAEIDLVREILDPSNTIGF